MRFFIVALILIITSVSPFAAEVSQEKKKRAVKSRDEIRARNTRKLISSFFLLNLVPRQNNTLSSTGIISIPDSELSGFYYSKNKYPLSFLQTPLMKKNAVESLYKNYGFNDFVKWKLDHFTTYKNSFLKRLSRSGRYIGTMVDIFSQKGLPVELAYLPLIESQFNPYAYSHRRASGPWQFMPSTARRLDLKIDWWIDERRDPVKSTLAAADYLKYLHDKFGSWNLALAAYNAGEGRIGKAIKIVGNKDFWSIRKTPYISRETKNYVPSYIAATAIAMNPENFGFRNINYTMPQKYDEVVIENPMDLEVVARFTGVETIDIKELNPELRRLCTPPNVSHYTLRIPRGTKRMFLKNLNKTKDYELRYLTLYTVKRGDTVAKIAKKIGSSIEKIINMNSLGRKALITIDNNILVPPETSWENIFK